MMMMDAHFKYQRSAKLVPDVEAALSLMPATVVYRSCVDYILLNMILHTGQISRDEVSKLSILRSDFFEIIRRPK